MEECRMSSTDFENVKGQIGYCGIWCGSCAVGNGVLRELAGRFQDMTEAYGLREWGPKDLNHDEFAGALQSIRRMSACPGCLKGGGRDDCEIRNCARKKSLDGCIECTGSDTCGHAEILQHMRSGALVAGLLVRAGESDREDLLRHWTETLASKWPCSVLFDEES
jgi:hypothetical protein